MGPDKKTDQGAIDTRRRGFIINHHTHLDPSALQTRADRQDHQMLLWVTSSRIGRLPFIELGAQTQDKAHLVERHFDPVRMNLDARNEGEEKRADILCTKIVPSGGKPRRHCQSKFVYFAKTSKPDFAAIDFPEFLPVDLSGSMAAPSI
jgi:hypothetical protein